MSRVLTLACAVLLLVFIASVVDLLATTEKGLVVEIAINGKADKVIYPFPNEAVFIESHNVWVSQNGIRCNALAAKSNSSIQGTFECTTKEGYKAQVAFDCQKNTSDNRVYMFFGSPMKQGNNRNFTFWCQ